jgi:hypothetical protein
MASTTDAVDRQERIDKYVALDSVEMLLRRLFDVIGAQDVLEGESWDSLGFAVEKDGLTANALSLELWQADDRDIDEYPDFNRAERRSSLIATELMIRIARSSDLLLAKAAEDITWVEQAERRLPRRDDA